MDKYAALQTYFGHSTFRPGQEAIIDTLLCGRDVLAVMPTGAGKSICYQVPAVLLGGVTLVVSRWPPCSRRASRPGAFTRALMRLPSAG